MPAVTCAGCNVKVKLPDTFAGKSFRCPKCKHVNSVAPAAAPAEAPNLKPRGGKPGAWGETKPAGKPRADGGRFPTGAAALEGHGIPNDIRDEVVDLLDADERVLWVGRPNPKAVVGSYEFLVKLAPILLYGGGGAAVVGLFCFVMPLALWLIDVIPMVVGILGAGLSSTLGVFGVFAVGLALVVRFGVKKANQNPERRSVYLITEQRAIIHNGDWKLPGGKIQIYEPEQLTNLQREDASRVPGCGTLVFKRVPFRHRGRIFYESHGFLYTENVRKAEAILREVLLDGVAPDEAESLQPASEEQEA